MLVEILIDFGVKVSWNDGKPPIFVFEYFTIVVDWLKDAAADLIYTVPRQQLSHKKEHHKSFYIYIAIGGDIFRLPHSIGEVCCVLSWMKGGFDIAVEI